MAYSSDKIVKKNNNNNNNNFTLSKAIEQPGRQKLLGKEQPDIEGQYQLVELPDKRTMICWKQTLLYVNLYSRQRTVKRSNAEKTRTKIGQENNIRTARNKDK